MKRLMILTIFGILAVVVFAKDLPRITVTKTFVVGDTAGWTDTFTSGWVNIEGAQKLHFYADLKLPKPNIEDTNFGADSFFVGIQLAMEKNGTVVKTVHLDTFLTTGAAFTGLDMLVADSIHGDWMRGFVIWRDTTNIDSAVIFGRTFGKILELYYSIQK